MLRVSTIMVLALLLNGCGGGDDGPTTYTVSGTVTLNGETLSQGDIIFRPADGTGQSYAGKVVDGAYQFECEAGEKKVEITSYREVPGQTREDNPGEVVNVTEQIVPANYNVNSELKASISADTTENNFDLTGDPPNSK
ncbi:MAG: hypothetical protein R3C18_17010 [Planctomycetaceae bacterium]